MRTCAIYNREANDTTRHCDWLDALADQSDCDVLDRDQSRSMDELIQFAVEQRYDRVIAVGGDGTVSRLIDTIQRQAADIEIGIVPTGTGNDLARSLAIPLDSIEAAWQIAAEGESRAIDVVQMINGRTSYFINAATAGFGGRVAADMMDQSKQRWGGLAYWFTALSNIADLTEYSIEVELDSCYLKTSVFGLCVANGRFAGGGFSVAPQAMVNDGMLDVTILPVVPMIDLVATGLSHTVLNRTLHDQIQTYRSSQIRLHSDPIMPLSIDGEPTRAVDATFQVIPRSVRIAHGAEAPAIGVAVQEGSEMWKRCEQDPVG